MAFLSYPYNFGLDNLDTNPFQLLTTPRTGSNALAQNREPSSSLIRNFSPRFDVRESKDAYHLDGELPGIDQKDIEIEFSDPHTMVIKGHVTRNYEHANAESDRGSGATSVSPSRQATVEDDDSDNDNGNGNGNDGHLREKRRSSPTRPQYRYWVSERSSGSFHRTFNFPVQVDEDAVKASLRNGVLTVHAPKQLTKKPLRRIQVD